MQSGLASLIYPVLYLGASWVISVEPLVRSHPRPRRSRPIERPWLSDRSIEVEIGLGGLGTGLLLAACAGLPGRPPSRATAADDEEGDDGDDRSRGWSPSGC